MVKEVELDEIFEEREDGSITISEDAPSTLIEAIRDAEDALDSQTKFVLRDVGKTRRALDFGVEDFTPIQTSEATLFASKIPEGVKILSVGVSNDGSLTQKQIEEVMGDLAQEAQLTTEETLKSTEASTALRSINQAKNFVIHNCVEVGDEASELILLLDCITEYEDEIPKQSRTVASKLHNLLSSVYTFTKTVDNGLKDLSVAGQTKHHLQKYEDTVSAAIGLRHCIQHNIALRVTWIARYSKEKEIFEYTIGIPLPEVNHMELYQGRPRDASGDSHAPTDYYYGDESDYLIDIEDMADRIRDTTIEAYNNLRDDLVEEDIEDIETINRYERMVSWRMHQHMNQKSDL